MRCSNICPGGVATDFAIGTGRTEDMPELDGMMSADDVAEVVHVRAHAAALDAADDDDVPADERGLVGLARSLGHPLDGADRRRASSRARAKTDAADDRRGRQPRRGDGAGVRRRARHPARARLLRGAAGRSRRRGGLHPAAQPHARRLDGAGAAGRQARALREADGPPARAGRARLRRRRGARARAERGVHVAPPPADARGCASCSTRARSATCGSSARASRSCSPATSTCAWTRRSTAAR